MIFNIYLVVLFKLIIKIALKLIAKYLKFISKLKIKTLRTLNELFLYLLVVVVLLLTTITICYSC